MHRGLCCTWRTAVVQGGERVGCGLCAFLDLVAFSPPKCRAKPVVTCRMLTRGVELIVRFVDRSKACDAEVWYFGTHRHRSLAQACYCDSLGIVMVASSSQGRRRREEVPCSNPDRAVTLC